MICISLLSANDQASTAITPALKKYSPLQLIKKNFFSEKQAK